MFSLTVLHISQLKLIHNIFGDPITGYKPNLLYLYSVSDLSENSQLWKKRETNFVELKCFRPCMYSIFDRASVILGSLSCVFQYSNDMTFIF